MRFLPAVLILGLWACSESAVKDSNSEARGQAASPTPADPSSPSPGASPAPSPAPSVVDYEGVSAPAQVAGGSLSCSALLKSGRPQAYLGCRFADSQGNRILASSIAQSISYEILPWSDADVSVTLLKTTAPSAAYEVFIDINASTLEKLDAALAGLQIRASYTGRKDGKADGAETSRISAINQPAVPDASGWNSFTIGSLGGMQDPATGLRWLSNDDGISRDFVTAESFCDDQAVESGIPWRLPTLGEMLVGRDNNINNYRTALKLVDTQYWTSTVANATSMRSLNIYNINQQPGTFAKTGNLGYICVAE